ncbi:MAG: Multidrug export protein MepA [Pseudomonadota bacterium]
MSARPAPSHLATAPILPTLLRLAAPNVLAMVMSVLVGIAETKYVGELGTAPLAAMAVVFPFGMLVQMMSGGAMGGGVSSAVSRALGAGDLTRARLLAWHALIVGGLAGCITTAVFLAFGPTLFAWLGARDEVLALAIGYALVLFSGAWLVWLLNTLASILRGTGDMRVPSATLLGCALLQILIGGSLGLGLGPIPRWGMPGVAVGQLAANTVGVLFLLWWLRSGRARLRLEASGFSVRREMFFDILKVGALACLSPTQSVITVLIMTGLIAQLGVAPLAGYGIGQRLEFMLVPIAFGIGVAAVPMVGMAIGAGDVARARKVAWTAGVLSAFNLGSLGLVVSLMPGLWSHFFSDDPQVLAFAAQYMHWAGPAFGLFGLGLTLYFASQGSGRILGPVIAATVRLALVAGVGYVLSERGAEPWQLFALVAAGMAVYGLSTALAVRLSKWGPAQRRPA